MILEKQTNAVILEEGTQDTIGMSLDLDSAQILMQMLSKNLYSDAIGSTIRECASNALDSHRRAGTTDPIIVSLQTVDGSYEFSVEDFGIGLDADDVKNIISKYGKSTKRNSANELGMMGLGFKAPLAYSSSFYFVARKNGMERKYMMYEGEDTNSIDLLYEAPTDKRNGVKVIIPLKFGDKSTFMMKIREQLAYFENVYFNVLDGSSLNNDFSIIRHEHFQFSPLLSTTKLHACLDNVYYPLDFEKLGLKQEIEFPVALRFSLTDGIFPTPNRESLRYTKEAIDTIKAKIQKVADYFIEKYNESVTETDDVVGALQFYSSSQKRIKSLDKNSSDDWYVTNLSSFSSIQLKKPVIKGIKLTSIEQLNRVKEYMFEEYEFKHELYNNRLSQGSRWNSVFSILSNKKHVYVYSDKLSGLKKDYLKSLHANSRNSVYILRKSKTFRLGELKDSNSLSTYRGLCKLYNYPRSEWRERIKELQYAIKQCMTNVIDLDTLQVPQSFINSRKKVSVTINGVPKQRRKKLQGEINCKEAATLERYVDGKNSKLVPKVIDMADAHRKPYLTIYGSTSHSSLIDNLFPLVDGRKVKLIVLSDRELKAIKDVDLHNWISMDKFMEGEHIVFKRIVTARRISQLIAKYRPVFDRINGLKKVSENLATRLDDLIVYAKRYHLSGENDIYEAMFSVADAKNLYDMSIYPEYLQIKELLDKLPFVNPTFSAMTTWREKDPMVDVVIDLFKYYKQRVNWKNYNITLNEENTTPVTEELINAV